MPQQRIVGFHLDDEGDWVAELACGHGRHVRHNPPWQLRPWVLTQAGRDRNLGKTLSCQKCVDPVQSESRHETEGNP